jgi:dihydroorotase
MPNVDLVLKGGSVYMPGGAKEADIAVQEGRISGIGEEGVFSSSAEVIDVSGLLVLPGVIDTHVHFRDPGFTYKEDFGSGTQAAAAGGITFAVDMPNTNPPVITRKVLEEKIEEVKGKAYVDFGFWAGGVEVDEIPGLLEAGALGIKLFMVKDPKSGYPHDPRLFTGDPALLYEIFKKVAACNAVVSVHPTNQDLFYANSVRCWETGNTTPMDFPEAYFGKDFIGDDSSTSTILILAASAGCHLHVLHLRSDNAIRMCLDSKKAGNHVTLESNPKWFFLDESDLKRLGPLAQPCGLSKEQTAVLWGHVAGGSIDVLGTDHAPHTLEEIEPGWKNAWEIPFGNPQLDDYVPLLLTRVNEGTLTLDRFVTLCSENPAKVMGVYPRKGVLRLGSDADFTIVDMKRERVLKNEDTKTRVGWTPYAGRKVKGVPVMTVVRGKVVMRDGEITGKLGDGQHITHSGV